MLFVAGRGSQERTRRQRLRASVFALALPLSLGPGWVLWATTPKASGPIRGSQRRLLESLLQVRLSPGGHGGGRVPSLLTVPANALDRSRVQAYRHWEETTKIGKGWVWDVWTVSLGH